MTTRKSILNGSLPSLLTIAVSVFLSITASIYARGYQSAQVDTLSTNVDKLDKLPERVSSIETTLNEISRRLNRIDNRLDKALGER